MKLPSASPASQAVAAGSVMPTRSPPSTGRGAAGEQQPKAARAAACTLTHLPPSTTTAKPSPGTVMADVPALTWRLRGVQTGRSAAGKSPRMTSTKRCARPSLRNKGSIARASARDSVCTT